MPSLFSAAQRRPRQPHPSQVTRSEYRPAADLFPFESRWYEWEGSRIHYIDEGSGHPLLLLHGNATFSFVYREIVTRLRDPFRCIAVDYPGFGLSDHPPGYAYTPAEHARCVLSLVRDLNLHDLVLMGQDWGGPIGLAVALGDPARIRGLIFANTWFWPADSVGFRLFGLVMSSAPGRWFVMRRNPFVEDTMRLGAVRPMPERVRDVYRAVLPTPASRHAVAALASQVSGARRWLDALHEEAPRRLTGIPMLLVWGMRDPAFGSEDVLGRWRSAFPEADVVRLAQASHYVQEDEPEAVAGAIRRKFG